MFIEKGWIWRGKEGHMWRGGGQMEGRVIIKKHLEVKGEKPQITSFNAAQRIISYCSVSHCSGVYCLALFYVVVLVIVCVV